MIPVIATTAAFFALVHLVCVGVLFKRVSGLPLRDELFRKNIRRPGYALKSELLFPQSAWPNLSAAGQGAVRAFTLARATAFLSVALGAAAVGLVLAGLAA